MPFTLALSRAGSNYPKLARPTPLKQLPVSLLHSRSIAFKPARTSISTTRLPQTRSLTLWKCSVQGQPWEDGALGRHLAAELHLPFGNRCYSTGKYDPTPPLSGRKRRLLDIKKAIEARKQKQAERRARATEAAEAEQPKAAEGAKAIKEVNFEPAEEAEAGTALQAKAIAAVSKIVEQLRADEALVVETRHGLAIAEQNPLPYQSNEDRGKEEAALAQTRIELDTGERDRSTRDFKIEDTAGAWENEDDDTPFCPETSRSTRRARRPSQPALVLDSIQGPARELYVRPPPGKADLSYVSPRPRKMGGMRSKRDWTPPADFEQTSESLPTDLSSDKNSHLSELSQVTMDGNPVNQTSELTRFVGASPSPHEPIQEREPLSLQNILARYLRSTTLAEDEFDFKGHEISVLQARGYSEDDVRLWATCLLDPDSQSAAKALLYAQSAVPLFVILLILRRHPNGIRQLALGTLMQHVVWRLEHERLNWSQLKLLVVRLLRHARVVWPESIIWIARLFTSETAPIFESTQKGSRSRIMSDATHFCNSLLWLLSLPASIHPILSAAHQQKAQFEVLRLMASQSPALIMSRTGFRGMIRTQDAHAKTPQERDWAELKGLSWPPWLHERTAMDEGKGYEYGASRASRMLHRMFEAGYGSKRWDEIAQVYAGWDTDLSPTIQTRTSMYGISPRRRKLGSYLWSARVTATRTRREAWACFLACEANGPVPISVYRAMFEKLSSGEVQESQDDKRDAARGEDAETSPFTPGDVREVWPEPKSTIDLVHITEPVPSYEELYNRLKNKGVGLRGNRNLVPFLINTAPNISMVVDLLQYSDYQSLLNGSILNKNSKLTDQVLASFIRALCRFGTFLHLPTKNHQLHLEHDRRFPADPHYLLEYAHALVIKSKSRYRPIWTTYLTAIMFGRYDLHHREASGKTIAQYRMVRSVLNAMRKARLDLDEEQFRLACMAVRHVALSALQGEIPMDHASDVFHDGRHWLRTIFQTLVSANADATPQRPHNTENPLPPHVPGPATLHIYVRALGVFLDFEGLYSFTTWATVNHAEVTARAQAQHSGPKHLRRTLIAVRAALEGRLRHLKETQAPLELMQLVKGQIEGVEEWGGWPSDDEVEAYLNYRQ